MNGILALGHFCETHGPCVILCTQRCEGNPKQGPHSLTVPWCEACQSIDLQQALMSRNEKGQFVTTRTPLQQDLAFLLKQATVRSLSCEEETNKEGSVLYFGDNERGHVFSHTFSLQDSLARGFHRRYCIIILMRDKVHLLNSWSFLVKHVRQIADDLKNKAAVVNLSEQEKQSQRSVRQAQGSPASPARSLSQLTNQPAIFAHLHLYFSWIFSTETTIEKPNYPLQFNPPKPSIYLRALYQEMGEKLFKIISFCILTGHLIICEDNHILNIFTSLLPNKWKPTEAKSKLYLFRENTWIIKWPSSLNEKQIPNLLLKIMKALSNMDLPDSALEHHLSALILHEKNTIKSLSKCKNIDSNLLKALNIQQCDSELIEYWLYNLSIEDKDKEGNMENYTNIVNNLFQFKKAN